MDQKLDLRALAKLAKACRRAGIKHFVGYGMEFTLDEAPQPTRRQSVKQATNTSADPAFESDMPSPEELLYWSVGDIPQNNGAE